MCCQSGERRSKLSLILLQLTCLTLHPATLQLALTVAPVRGTINIGDYKQVLQLVVMRRYENSNGSSCKGVNYAPRAPYNAYDSSARET
jgi:hypothetical protein